ncbi:MAG TPA: maltose alpha-D-glucosyltransferase [Stellaceae bacterium]|nr:maltose alpha-D-glucosyltransferase [Stellaceae bacterium]
MTKFDDRPDWYKDAIIYELHLKAFHDANGDGIGDIAGLIEKLDYIQDLGITAIWLLPFFPSPLRDDGYDVSNYRDVHDAYGTLNDFRHLIREAHKRGMRLIIELVVNHTSDQHPWFQRARKAKPGSVARNYYVWSDTNEKYKGTRIIFTDTEKSNWTWDPEASAFYWHRFFSHQPDLNFDNPHVLRSVLNVMGFWFDLGIDGFRLDAIPYLCEREGTSCENLPETHAILKNIRAELDRKYPGKLLLAEANQWPEDVKDYFGAGDECHMAFHFPLMPRIYMAIASEDRHPIADIMRQTPEIPDNCQWAIFLRNHDELTLEMVTDAERDYLWRTYAADRRARLNLGIRRRLAPLMQNDRRKIELVNALLLSMPGTPIIYYGDELGMGDNIYLGDRDGVRTPMQWTPDRNGGFSRADPAQLYLPPIMDAVYGYHAVNVEAQSRSLSSLLNWMKRLISVRQSLAVFGRGTLSFLYPANRAVIAYLRQHEKVTVLCVANLSRSAQPVELELSAFAGRIPVELLGRTAFPAIGETWYSITLQGYGFFWFELTQPDEAQKPTTQLVPELVTLVETGGLSSAIGGRNLRLLERDVLPAYLRARRWFAQKSERALQIRAEQSLCFALGGREWCWMIAEASGRETVRYSLPVGEDWQAVAVSPASLAKVRRSYKEGLLVDALFGEEFVRCATEAMLQGTQIATAAGTVVFKPTPAFLAAPKPEKQVIRLRAQEQSNSSAIIDDWLIMKFYRRIAVGTHPEIELGAFLTADGLYANTPTLFGSIHFVDGAGHDTALGVVHALIRNQGDGWTYTLAYLDRHLQDIRVASTELQPSPSEHHSAYLVYIEQLARRTAEFHRTLYVEAGDPAFAVERAGPECMRDWGEEVVSRFEAALAGLHAARGRLAADALAGLDDLLAHRDGALAHIRELAASEAGVLLSRCHGDYHLGQTLVVQNDISIVDFEGPPQLSLEERRAKHSIVRDVASMMRSFDYAAWTALDYATASQPDRRNELSPAVLQWRDQVTARFLDTYVATMGDCPLWPRDEKVAQRLLALLLIEKAALEIDYELGNRPGWAGVPLTGLRTLLLGRQIPERSDAAG